VEAIHHYRKACIVQLVICVFGDHYTVRETAICWVISCFAVQGIIDHADQLAPSEGSLFGLQALRDGSAKVGKKPMACAKV